MNDDEILILLFLLENDDVTTTEIAKALFIPENNGEKYHEELTRAQKNDKESLLRNSDRKVRYYLDKFIEDNLVNVKTVNGKKRFRVNRDSVHLGMGKIDMITYDGNTVSIGLGKILLCKVKDGIVLEPIPD